MRYMLLIYHDEAKSPRPGTPAFDQQMADYNEYTQEVQTRNLMLHGEALHPVAAATTVRVREGGRLVTDGPFAETKEQLGGFYLLNCKDLDEAIEMAGKIPDARGGSIEIRPVVDFG